MNTLTFADSAIIIDDGNGNVCVGNVHNKEAFDKLKEMYDDYVRMQQLSAQALKDRFTIPKKPEENFYFLYDPADESIIGDTVPEAEVVERIRKYAEEDCEGFEDTFDVQVYKLASTYECEPIQRVEVTLKKSY